MSHDNLGERCGYNCFVTAISHFILLLVNQLIIPFNFIPMSYTVPNYTVNAREQKRSVVLKRIMIALSVILTVGIVTVIYLWNLPHKKVENVKGITISAVALTKEYAGDEQAANKKYLNKAIEVSGSISELDQNQDGGTMVILQTDDAMASVQCAMRDKNIALTKGQSVVIKGFCSGNGITGVSLTDCVLKEILKNRRL